MMKFSTISYLGITADLGPLAITLNLLFLFIFGAGQICFCSESDNCQGTANLIVSKKTVKEDSEELQIRQSPLWNQDCCVHCFSSMEIAVWAFNLFDGTSFELTCPIPPWTTFEIAANDGADRPRVRAPPNGFGSPGTKTYLAIQSLLI